MAACSKPVLAVRADSGVRNCNQIALNILSDLISAKFIETDRVSKYLL